jgi:hypothetical protein
MTIPKIWVPEIGEKVKLKLWEDYTAVNLSPWGWFEVVEIPSAKVNEFGTRYIPEDEFGPEKWGLAGPPIKLKTILMAAGVEARIVEVKIKCLAPSCYWMPVYKIYVYDDTEARRVWSWITEGRGIRCMGSQDLSSAGDRAYVPGDREKPHWKYDNGEVVKDPDRIQIILLTKHPIPTGNPSSPYTAAEYDKAKKAAVKERKKALADMKSKGKKVFNVKDSNYVFESWWESEETWKPPAEPITAAAK